MTTQSQNITTTVTAESFLRGCCGGYPVTDETLQYISVKTEIVLDTPIEDLNVIEKDKLEIEMLRYLLRAPGMTQSVTDQNGSWSHKEGAVELNSIDKKNIKIRLRELESKYGIVSKSSIRLNNLGMKLYGGKVD